MPQLISVAVFQVLVVILLSGSVIKTRISGDSVVLEVTSVQLVTANAGNNAQLTYSFSSQLPPQTGLREPAQSPQPIYACLQRLPNRPQFDCSEVTWNKPASGLFIKGRMTADGHPLYGIEQTNITEDARRLLLPAATERRLCAEITIDKSGQAILRRLFTRD